MCSESSRGSLILVVSHMPIGLNFVCKHEEIHPKNHQYTLHDGTMLQVMKYGALEAHWHLCSPSQVYLKVINPSISALKVTIDGLDIYSQCETTESETDLEYSSDDLKKGIVLESERAMQRILKKILAKKWLIFFKAIIKLYCWRVRFLKRFYSPNDKGFQISKNEYEMLWAVYLNQQSW